MADVPQDPSTETFFLGQAPPPQVLPLRADALDRGSVVGRYVILDCIGTGGMGVVYSAYDPELDRKVALKLLRPDRHSASGETGRLRLLREAQAIAKLSHPNVIVVFDTGSLGDQVFVAMEFVEGRTLRQWLEEERPSWREILELFLLAGRGLAAAHAAGLVHRDFKPDNVLLGKDGRVRVVDFGLARPFGEPEAFTGGEVSPAGSGGLLASPLTQWGVAMGTPAYMAPEQLRGEAADARSDQFSFCVSLYEALYGDRPFPGTEPRENVEAMRRGAAGEPQEGRVPKRLRAVLLRGLSADPKRRYPSMEALLRELERDPSAVRRRWLAAAAVVLVVGALFSSLGYFQARRVRLCSGAEQRIGGLWDAERKPVLRAAFLATGVPVAAATWNTVEHALDRYTADWAVMRRQACEATRIRGEQSEDLLDRRMFCLDQRLQETSAVIDLFARADRKVVERAVSTAAGLPSIEACADVAALTARMPPPRDPGLRARVDAVRAKVAEARVLTRAGKPKEALATAAAAAAQATRLGYAPTRAEALYQKGFDQDQTGDSQGAEETLFDAFVAAQEASHQEVAARAASQLAWVTGWEQARTAEGHRWSRLAIGIAEGARSGDALRAELFQQLGGVLANERRYSEAADISLRALALNERAFGRDHIKLAPILNNLGEIYNELGRHQEALRFTLRGIELRKRRLEPDHPDFGRSYNALGNIYAKLDKQEEAAAAFERALAIDLRHYGPNHWLTGSALGNLGFAYQHLGRLDKAMEYDRRALASFEAGFGPEHPNVATVRAYIGDVLRLQGKPAEALTSYDRAWSIQEKSLAPDDPDRAVVLAGRSQALVDLGRAREAVPACERALALLEGKPLDPKELQQTRFVLARALWEAGNRVRATRLALQARQGLAAAGHRQDQREVEAWLRQRGQTW